MPPNVLFSDPQGNMKVLMLFFFFEFPSEERDWLLKLKFEKDLQ